MRLDLDDLMNDLDERERRDKGEETTVVKEDDEFSDLYKPKDERLQVGKVEHFFDKLSVAAIRLSGSLKVGDTIEIGDDSPVRETVASMQIDRKEIDEAGPGDDVGIKLANRVPAGSSVYLVR